MLNKKHGYFQLLFYKTKAPALQRLSATKLRKVALGVTGKGAMAPSSRQHSPVSRRNPFVKVNFAKLATMFPIIYDP